MDLEKTFYEIIGLCQSTTNSKDERLKRITDNAISEIFEKIPKLLAMKDRYGMNLGMYTAKYGLENSTLIALDNKEASTQQDNYGNNIGIYAANSKLERAVLKALNNKKASVMQGFNGLNIGMCAAINGLDKAVEKALKNKIAKNQVDNQNKTIEIHYNEYLEQIENQNELV